MIFAPHPTFDSEYHEHFPLWSTRDNTKPSPLSILLIGEDSEEYIFGRRWMVCTVNTYIYSGVGSTSWIDELVLSSP